jgi:GntR family transcriptional repressor for pyruvate dehydrogenase complex
MIIMEANAARVPRTTRQRTLRQGREKVSEWVARDILRMISTRNLPSGSILPPEAEMLAEYGVSRGSLREALRILEVHGVILMKAGPKGGPVVLDADPADFGKTAMLYFETNGATFADLLDARLYLEPLMARLAAERRTEEQAEQLASLAASFAPQHSHESVEEAIDFHVLVAKLSGNRVLALLANSFSAIIAPYERTSLSPDLYASIVKIHERIATAIIKGDGDAAEAAMRRHMTKTVEDFNSRHPAMVHEIVRW